MTTVHNDDSNLVVNFYVLKTLWCVHAYVWAYKSCCLACVFSSLLPIKFFSRPGIIFVFCLFLIILPKKLTMSIHHFFIDTIKQIIRETQHQLIYVLFYRIDPVQRHDRRCHCAPWDVGRCVPLNVERMSVPHVSQFTLGNPRPEADTYYWIIAIVSMNKLPARCLQNISFPLWVRKIWVFIQLHLVQGVHVCIYTLFFTYWFTIMWKTRHIVFLLYIVSCFRYIVYHIMVPIIALLRNLWYTLCFQLVTVWFKEFLAVSEVSLSPISICSSNHVKRIEWDSVYHLKMNYENDRARHELLINRCDCANDHCVV